MPLNVNTLVTKVQQTLGVDDTDVGFAASDILVMANQILWEIDNEFKFKEQELHTIINTIIGQADYDLSVLVTDLSNIVNVSIQNLNSFKHTDLARMTIRDYEDSFVDDEDAYGTPSKYLRENFTLRLWPTPDNVYPIILHYRGQLADLVAATIIDSVPSEWQNVIYYGTVAMGHFQQQQYRKHSIAQAMYERLANQLKPVELLEEEDSHVAGVSIIRTPYLKRFR